MKRRKFLLGLGGTAAGGAALLGSGAFSRVESQRDVTIQVAEDPNAYLGLDGTGSLNSNNYVDIDDDGHLAIDVSEHDDFDGPDTAPGEGVNSDSFTYFDSMVRVCNQGKEAAGFYIEPPSDDDFPAGIDAEDSEGNARLQFYTGTAAETGDAGTTSIMGEDNAEVIGLGECIELGLRTVTRGVDATAQDQLFGDEVTLVADVDVNPEFGEPPDDPVVNTHTGETFATIQPAIDAADGGDTIQVLTGTTFDEDVVIDKPGLTLEATSDGKPVISGQVDLAAAGTVLDGFRVSPSDPATDTLDNEAVRITAPDVSVVNNTVTDFPQNFDGFGELIGIVATNADSTPIGNVLISGNKVTGLQANGTSATDVAAVGISIAGAVNATVEANLVSNIGGDRAFYAWGIVARETGGEVPTNVELLDNTIESITSEDGFNERFFGVGFGYDTGADASVLSATGNSVETPELIVENKDPDNEIDATGNWWGDPSGPDETRIAGEAPRRAEVEAVLSDFGEERGPVDTSSPLGSPPG